MGFLHELLNVGGATDIAFEGEVSCAEFLQFSDDVVERRYVNYDDRSTIVGKGFRYVSPYTLCCPRNHRDSLVCHNPLPFFQKRLPSNDGLETGASTTYRTRQRSCPGSW